jgi:transcriptional regulator with PAS, ATPase and Fis domain
MATTVLAKASNRVPARKQEVLQSRARGFVSRRAILPEYLERGENVSVVARRLGISRAMVYRVKKGLR